MKKIIFIVFLFLSIVVERTYSQQAVPIDIVLCMDLSGSTNGLIENLRERIWDIANEINAYSPAASLRIGIVAYSRPQYKKENYYVRVIADLTDDIDFVQNELFTIKTTTEQGSQYVGPAIYVSVSNMSWSKQKNAFKVLFIVGNGIVNLSGNDYIQACEKAVSKKIILNPVFCKTYMNVKEILQWRNLAELGKGEYYEIDINKKTFVIPTIYDVDYLRELNFQFNKTYVYYGLEGKKRFGIQEDLDNKATAINEMSFQSRLVTKVSRFYQETNFAWDLVDLANRQQVDWSAIDRATLPENLQKMNDDELKKYVDGKWSERRQIIGTIRILCAKRTEIVKEKKRELKLSEGNTLGNVVIESMNKIAPEKGFKVGN